MQTFAHIENGVVREVLFVADELVLGKDLYSPAIADACVPCSDTVTEGMLYDAVTGKFSAAPPLPPVIPASVTKAQAKIQLLRSPAVAGGKSLLDDVTNAVNVAGGEVEIWFSDAASWERSNPYVAQLGSALKLKSADIDALFVAAAQIAA